MQKSKEAQHLKAMVAELESLDSGFDWLMDVGDDEAAIVRKTYRSYAGAIVEDLGLRMQRALAAIGPEGSAPMQAIITTTTIDLRPASAWTFSAPRGSRPTKSSWRRPDRRRWGAILSRITGAVWQGLRAKDVASEIRAHPASITQPMED